MNQTERIYKLHRLFEARWVGTESWHPDQRGEFAAGGDFVLRVP